MLYTAYVIVEPGADRPYFSHSYPSDYQMKPGAKVYEFTLPIPGFEKVDGVLTIPSSIIPCTLPKPIR